MVDREDQTMSLPDGRVLGFAEYGDPDGYPLLSFHGTISSRLDVDYSHDVARRMGVRIIGVDRPGMGLSTYQPHRTLLDWVPDVTALADHLNIDRFGVYGWSAGGQYALAVAAKLPDRVTAATILGGPKPYNNISGMKGIPGLDRMLMIGSHYTPIFIRAGLRFSIVNASDDKVFSLVKEDMSEPDVIYLDERGQTHVVKLVREAVRQGTRGPVRDFRILATPWGFPLSEVVCAVDVWIAEHDHLGPTGEAADLVALLPNATLHEVADEGHISLPDRCLPQILGAFLAHVRQ